MTGTRPTFDDSTGFDQGGLMVKGDAGVSQGSILGSLISDRQTSLLHRLVIRLITFDCNHFGVNGYCSTAYSVLHCSVAQ